MKFNWKRLAALLLAVILMLSLTGMGEEEITIVDGASKNAAEIGGDLSIEGDLSEPDVSLDDSLELDLSNDMLNSLDEITLEQPNITEPEGIEQEESNASNNITLGVKETYQLSKKGLGKKLSFKSSKPKVVSVSDTGLVTGLKKGTAEVTILSGTTEKKRYTVQVVAAPSKITLPSKSITLGVKESVTFEPKITNGSHTTFTWTTSDNAVAIVGKSGKITARKAGKANITVKTHNGKKAVLKVTVAKAPTGVTLNKTSATLDVGDTLKLKASLPEGTASSKLTWKSSDTDVATVSEKGIVSAVDSGTAKITVTTYNGKKATCNVTVESSDPEEPVLSADPTKVTVSAGQSYSVTITYLNDNTIRWSVGDSNIATCKWGEGWDGDTCQLIITGVNAGSTIVTVRDTVTEDYVDIYVTVTGSSGYSGDLLGAYGMDFDEFNSVVDDPLSYYDYSNGKYYYVNSYMLILVSASTGNIEGIMLTSESSKYTLTGVYPGMSLYTAEATALNANWSSYKIDGNDYWYRATYKGKTVYLVIAKDSYSSTVKSVTMV